MTLISGSIDEASANVANATCSSVLLAADLRLHYGHARHRGGASRAVN